MSVVHVTDGICIALNHIAKVIEAGRIVDVNMFVVRVNNIAIVDGVGDIVVEMLHSLLDNHERNLVYSEIIRFDRNLD